MENKNMNDYAVRYGGDGYCDTYRSDYMDKREALQFYDKIKLDTKTTWKELLYEPETRCNYQRAIKSDSVRVVDFGFCKMVV